MGTGQNIFINSSENRLRAFWRISFQFVLFLGAYLLPVFFLDLIDSGFYKTLFDEVITLLLVLLAIWISTRFFDKRKFSDIGFKFNRNWFAELFQGFLIGTIVFLIVFLIELSLSWISIDKFSYLDSPVEYSLKLIGRLFGFVCVAVMEEAFSRGYQLKNISEGLFTKSTSSSKAVLRALLISSILFGAMHAANPNITIIGIVNLSLIGGFYGYAYVATGSLALPIGIHTAWNFIQGNIFGFPVSGIEPQISFINISQTGSLLVTGGDFGPEGGLLILFGVASGILLINYLICGNPLKFFISKEIAIYKKL